jgi:ribosomal protein S12 methylthiotransferase accessory factor YcaO
MVERPNEHRSMAGIAAKSRDPDIALQRNLLEAIQETALPPEVFACISYRRVNTLQERVGALPRTSPYPTVSAQSDGGLAALIDEPRRGERGSYRV